MASEQSARVVEAVAELAGRAGFLSDRFDVARARSALSALGKLPVPDGVSVIDAVVAGRPAQWLLPHAVPAGRRLLYLHGGAYVSGGLDSHRAFAGLLAQHCRLAVLLLDYRLAPEHPFPAALEDACAAFLAIAEAGPHGREPAGALFVAGDSAGGGLATATALELIARGARAPDAVATLSGWMDLTLSGESLVTRRQVEAMLHTPWARSAVEAYCAGCDPAHPRISPLFADFSGFPPFLIQVGDHEILLDDSRRVAERARQAGVDVSLEVWPEMFHVWQTCGPALPEAMQAVASIGSFLGRHALPRAIDLD
jgi:acetyl esterase/lipase